MSDDISVPIIEICNGWTVDEIYTEDDCDDAHAVLTALIVSIEARMDDLAIAGEELSVEYKHAKKALRWKKAALSVVGTKRGKINRAKKEAEKRRVDSQLCSYFAAMHPEEFRRAVLHVEAGTSERMVEAAE